MDMASKLFTFTFTCEDHNMNMRLQSRVAFVLPGLHPRAWKVVQDRRIGGLTVIRSVRQVTSFSTVLGIRGHLCCMDVCSPIPAFASGSG